MADGRVSQDAVEILATTVAVVPTAARVSQDAIELLATTSAVVLIETRVTQDAVETMTAIPPAPALATASTTRRA